MPKSFCQARWVSHPRGIHAPKSVLSWLVDTKSLTHKLKMRSQHFCVVCLEQNVANSLADEYKLIQVKRRQRVYAREVLLCCDDQPMVFAHTIIPFSATKMDWPFFKTLGERSLGSTLFGDPKVKRGHFQFARLGSNHPLVQRAYQAIPNMNKGAAFYARRCLFKRRQSLMLVTELFLSRVFN